MDTVFARFTIDFQSKAGHTMDLPRSQPDRSSRSPKTTSSPARPPTSKGCAKWPPLHHLDLIKLVITSFNGKATVDQIQAALVPDIIKDDWKKWWEAAKRELKKDGHFQVPLKKTEPIVYQVKEVSLQERLFAEFTAAKGLKARIVVAGEVLKNILDLNDKTTAANDVIAALNTEIATHQRTQPAVALEAIFIRDDLREAAGVPPLPENSRRAIFGRRKSNSPPARTDCPPSSIAGHWSLSRPRILKNGSTPFAPRLIWFPPNFVVNALNCSFTKAASTRSRTHWRA